FEEENPEIRGPSPQQFAPFPRQVDAAFRFRILPFRIFAFRLSVVLRKECKSWRVFDEFGEFFSQQRGLTIRGDVIDFGNG
ncbi:hypothetical protein AVEN_182621-1, partial [Araneus ventricosus]